MAATQGSQQPGPSAFWPHSRTTAAASRLRDSCNACASSKVRCSKEKPICSRCAKRHTACEYHITKRPGRKHEARTSESHVDQAIMPPTMTNKPTTTDWPANFPGDPALDMSLPSLYPVQPPEDSNFPSLGSEFGDFLTSPTLFSLPDVSDFDMLGGTESTLPSEKRDSSKLGSIPTPPEDIIYLFGDETQSPSVHSKKAGQHGRTHDAFERTSQGNTTSCCLSRALDNLNRLSSKDAMRCRNADLNNQPHSADRRSSDTVQAVIARNEEAFHDMERILKCTCSSNGFVVTTMALVVFKALDWYASAVRLTSEMGAVAFPEARSGSTPSSPRSIISSTGQYCTGVDAATKSAQQVLVELHRVQQFLTKLDPHIRACTRSPSTGIASADQDSSQRSATPFSSTIVEKLEPELRRRVRELSLDIMKILRQD